MRIAFHVGIILSVLFFPWWATAIIITAACFVVDRFYEAIVYGIAIDALYGTSIGFYGHTFVWTLGTLLLFILSQPIRQRLSW